MLLALGMALMMVMARSVAARGVAAQDGGRPALLFVVTGQSNAGQQGRAGQLPAGLAGGVPGAWLYAPQATRQQRLVPMAAYRGYFGPELPIAAALRAVCPGQDILIAKTYSGGTSIVAWDPAAPGRAGWRQDMARVGNETKPAMWPRVLTSVNAAGAGWGGPVEVAGVFYIQTERDSRIAWGAAHYEANLRQLIAAWRREWGAGLPVVFMDSHTNLSGGGPRVHEAVAAVAGSTPGAAWVPVRDLTKKPDKVHFDSAGVLGLGERMAAEWLRLAGGCE